MKTAHYFKTFGKFGTEQGRTCFLCGEGIMHENHDMLEIEKARNSLEYAEWASEMIRENRESSL